ncbi:hypothetical protein BGX34_010608 [Mortierella sp. NVP85]|nr:hypothetical protein BGX34_010608 [Mortierella sp. NVP85]
MQLETLSADSYPTPAPLSPVSIGCTPQACPHGYRDGFGCENCSGEYPLTEGPALDYDSLLVEEEEELDFPYAADPDGLDADIITVNALDDLEEEEEEDLPGEGLTSENDVVDHQEELTAEDEKAQPPVPECDADVDPSLPVIEVLFDEKLYELFTPSSEAFKTSYHTATVTRGGLLFSNYDSLLEEPLSVLFDHLRAELLVARLGIHDEAAQYELRMVFKGLQDLSLCEHEDATGSFSLAKLVRLYIAVTGMQGQEMLLEPFHIELTAHETFATQLNRIQRQMASKTQQQEQQQQEPQAQPISAVDNGLQSGTLETDARLQQSETEELLMDEQLLGMIEGEDVSLVHSDEQTYEHVEEDEFGPLDDESALELEITTLDSNLTSDSSPGRSPKRTVEELIDMLDEDFVNEIDPDGEMSKRRKKDN